MQRSEQFKMRATKKEIEFIADAAKKAGKTKTQFIMDAAKDAAINAGMSISPYFFVDTKQQLQEVNMTNLEVALLIHASEKLGPALDKFMANISDPYFVRELNNSPQNTRTSSFSSEGDQRIDHGVGKGASTGRGAIDGGASKGRSASRKAKPTGSEKKRSV